MTHMQREILQTYGNGVYTLKLSLSGEGITTEAAVIIPLESQQARGRKSTSMHSVFEVCRAAMIG